LLPAYVEHLKSQPCTLLCRFVGLYEVRHRKLGRLSFVVMENIIGKAGDLPIHELYVYAKWLIFTLLSCCMMFVAPVILSACL
jgi:hypothetical protein